MSLQERYTMPRKMTFIVTDLGGGDGGKGGVVHKICTMKKAHTVIKVGGAQGSHGVQTANGQLFNFTHFGCGTLEGVRTHISRAMVIDPHALVYEGKLLKYAHGIRNIFDLLTVDEDALCVTPFHRMASQLRELARKDNPKGTVGTGVGEAVVDAGRFPDLAILVRDIGSPKLHNVLESVREQKLHDLAAIIADIGNFLESDQGLAQLLVTSLRSPGFVDATIQGFREMVSLVNVVDTGYIGEIFSRDSTVVVECSHGILTDRYHGFHPHTTRLRTVPRVVLNMIDMCGYEGDVVRLGITRAYQIRHGAGPMVTECPEMLENLLPGSHKENNRWQGSVRVGPLDFVALRYAIEACGGPEAFDGLAVTWFDQVRVNGKWYVCDGYRGAGDSEFFLPNGEIKIRRGADEKQLEHQNRLGNLLRTCRPNITSYDVPTGMSEDDLAEFCAGVMEEKLHVPVRMVSLGPTENDKVLL
ncbi:MAG: adenylosuccinate synthase [Parcubacteria group bacterium Gr01-1014_70]|nr:MAG: adenylosuccinate synthase [Parcubacteria group bacterium Gr01-1014_70]